MMDLFPLWLGNDGGELQVVEIIEVKIEDKVIKTHLVEEEEIRVEIQEL